MGQAVRFPVPPTKDRIYSLRMPEEIFPRIQAVRARFASQWPHITLASTIRHLLILGLEAVEAKKDAP